jgi:hypothetical protein
VAGASSGHGCPPAGALRNPAAADACVGREGREAAREAQTALGVPVAEDQLPRSGPRPDHSGTERISMTGAGRPACHQSLSPRHFQGGRASVRPTAGLRAVVRTGIDRRLAAVLS